LWWIWYSCGGFGGWFNWGNNKDQRWQDYIKVYHDDQKPYLETIRKEIVKNKFRFGGDRHQENMIPLFSDDTVGCFSYRAWGDLMAAIWSEEENKDYSYMDFYMDCLIEN